MFPKHADAFAPSWHKFLKFCHDGDRLLTVDVACTSFDWSNKEHCSAVRTAGASLGIWQIPGYWGSENGCLWMVVNTRAWYLSW